MIALIKKEMFNDKLESFILRPYAIFPAIIFPAIFLDESGFLQFENNPKILASIIAVIIGTLSKNIIATIVAGLAVYWFLIFI